MSLMSASGVVGLGGGRDASHVQTSKGGAALGVRSREVATMPSKLRYWGLRGREGGRNALPGPDLKKGVTTRPGS
jgi:hypothetical protein